MRLLRPSALVCQCSVARGKQYFRNMEGGRATRGPLFLEKGTIPEAHYLKRNRPGSIPLEAEPARNRSPLEISTHLTLKVAFFDRFATVTCVLSARNTNLYLEETTLQANHHGNKRSTLCFLLLLES